MTGAPGAPRQAALAAGLLLLAVYLATAAPSLTFWDAGEFATAIGTFGIPHPPGTPLYVAAGTALWRLVPGLSPVQAGSLLSALCTAAACGIAAALITQVTRSRTAGISMAVCAGAMGTVWMNATETEVYAASLLAAVVQLAAAWRAHARDDDSARVLVAYVAALSIPLHLSALVAAPAALLLACTTRDGRIDWWSLLGSALIVLATAALARGWLLAAAVMLALTVDPRLLTRGPRSVAGATRTAWLLRAAPLVLVAWSGVAILLLRARHDPFLNQGAPDGLRELLAVVTRAQYDVAAPWPRRAPLWLQLGNLGQYADWQVALGFWNDVVPHWRRTPFTLLALVLGGVGALAHWRVHRITARAMLVLFLLATIGVVLQLNLRAGPSFGIGVLPEGALHEARERDYFFALAFWCWGLWIGAGALAVAHRRSWRRTVAVLVPLALIAGNWSAVTRDVLPDRHLAGAIAGELLAHVPPGGTLFTAGDNDSYPVWYRQAVDSVRRDVSVVVVPLLPAAWYARQSAHRAGQLTADTSAGSSALVRAGRLARQRLDRGASVAVSLLLPSSSRDEFGRIAGVTCWRRAGLVDIGSRVALCPPRVDAERTQASAHRLAALLAPTPRQSPDGMIAAFIQVARCPAATIEFAVLGGVARDTVSRRLLDLTCNLR
ncbi:MAG: DUF2723 domain-containing protein [Gemmatimonadaceae bacterium]|nr:DUF2723 domain-containing protein [Gemmatimonadaceae bacterium]